MNDSDEESKIFEYHGVLKEEIGHGNKNVASNYQG
jgi:hypothetical protein